MQFSWPSPYQLMLGTSLAIISFVGLESISQAAQETQRPASIIPRTSVALILTILIFALAYSNLALGLQPWHPIVNAAGHPMQFWQIFPNNADNQGKAVALLAAQVPYYGAFAALYVPILGAVLLLISSNSGVFGSSRIAYAMSTSNLLPSIFQRVHAKFRTPVISIVFFSTIAHHRVDLRRRAGALSGRRPPLFAVLPRRKRARVPRRPLRLRRGDELFVRLSRL